MSSSFGQTLRVTIFGQSHGPAVGVVLDGLPAGETLDEAALQAFMDRRAGGRAAYTTPRGEADRPVFLSGLLEGRTCGAPLCAIVENGNVRSGDYAQLADVPRPSHADYPAHVKFKGFQDPRGGGHFSGRLTAALCVAGGIALQILARRGVAVGAHIAAVEGVADRPFDPVAADAQALLAPGQKDFPVQDDEAGRRMVERILAASAEKDSVGGVVECAAAGFPAGIGSPMFGGLENRLAAAIFGIPAVRGLEFGSGFAAAGMRGSQHNDPYVIEDGRVVTETNRHGGILGGISTGMPIVLRAAFKPTASIAREQRSVSLSGRRAVTLAVRGRHDPCIVPRAVPCVEAAVALVLLDALLEENPYCK